MQEEQELDGIVIHWVAGVPTKCAKYFVASVSAVAFAPFAVSAADLTAACAASLATTLAAAFAAAKAVSFATALLVAFAMAFAEGVAARRGVTWVSAGGIRPSQGIGVQTRAWKPAQYCGRARVGSAGTENVLATCA